MENRTITELIQITLNLIISETKRKTFFMFGKFIKFICKILNSKYEEIMVDIFENESETGFE